MKAKRIGGGVLLASALVAGWLIVTPPWAGDAGMPVVVASATDPGSGGERGSKKEAPAYTTATTTTAQPMRPTAVVVATPKPVTGGPRAYGYGVMDENGQVIPPPRTVVMAEVRPGMPENEVTGTERGHDRGPNFNLGLYRQADGSVYRP